MLYLIGLGLWDETDLTLKGLEAAKKSEKAYLEAYTSRPGGLSPARLEKLIGKKITLLKREDVEGAAAFLDEAKKTDVSLFVGGDPLVATTHADLLLRAAKKRVPFRVIHNASIYSAVAETGLQVYKFGKTATVVYPEKNYKPTSFYDAVRENRERGLHSLLLLDIKPDRTMTPKDAIELLAGIDPNFAKQEIVVCSRMGSEKPFIAFGDADKLAKSSGEGMSVIIVPGGLHDVEKEYLEQYRVE
jgi:diphthine synthase